MKPKIKSPKDWDRRFLQLAELVASWSKDSSTKVGAVAVRDRRILASGYNGLPTGVVDSQFRLEDRDTKLLFTQHAEANCISFAARTGVSLLGSTIYVWPMPPCAHCAASIIQAGIGRVVVYEVVVPQRWQQSFDAAADMFSEAGVALLRLPESADTVPDEVPSNIASKIPPGLRSISS